MSLETNLSKELFKGNGSTKTFAFHFRAWTPQQVKVYVAQDGADVEVSSSCNIVLNDTAGGTVTFANAPGVDVNIAIVREMPFLQEDRYVSGSRFDPHEIEDRFDQDCAERQELLEKISRALLAPVTSNMDGNEIYADKLLEAAREAIEARDYIGSLDIDRLDPLTRIPNEIAAVAGIADKIPPVAENAHDLSVIADDLQGLPLMSLDLGYVRDPAEPINDVNSSILAQLVENADAIADIADHLDELLGIVSTAQAAAAEARQSASSAMASEARIQSLEDETRELIATNYAEVLQNGN